MRILGENQICSRLLIFKLSECTSQEKNRPRTNEDSFHNSVVHFVEILSIHAICLLKAILLLILYFLYMRAQKKMVSIYSLSKI